MRTRLRSICGLFTLTILLTGVTFTAADEKDEKKDAVDPSGTWRWEHDEGGETIKDILKLNYDGKKLTGTYTGRRGPFDIKDGKVEKDEVSFGFDIEADGRKFVIKFSGRVKKDDVDGTVAFEVDDESREFPWSAKRSLKAEDVVGTWNLAIETPNGNTLMPNLTLSLDKEKKKLSGNYTSSNGDVELDVSDIQVKDNHLRYTVSGEFNGNTLTAKYDVEPRGDKLSGKIAFEFNGESGELEVEGKRKAKKKS